ncbi:MAG: SagB/ThcOx family dehydrogenase [Nitrospirae bacterium]|nr:SagB/ThcOx family dehydrogenase [Nitrospirota bacterium]MBI5696167.1 SagB/ThcOx family dehydrogenase [Nitrospirota bacterium]
MKIEKENVGDAFQQVTKYDRDDMPRGGLDLEKRPGHYKVYEDPIMTIELGQPDRAGGAGLWDVLDARRTRRTYRPEPLALGELSQMLWAANGKTKEGREAVLRTAPSAGALYPIVLYVMANDVEGLEKGIYHYDVPGHRLVMIREGDYSDAVARAALGQSMLAKAGAVIFLTAIIERTRWKYRQRAYRYIYLDAGHIGQNICLAAGGMGLGTCPIGAFYDDELNAVLGLDGTEETVVYAFAIGR